MSGLIPNSYPLILLSEAYLDNEDSVSRKIRALALSRLEQSFASYSLTVLGIIKLE
jgi:hypothetical protein